MVAVSKVRTRTQYRRGNGELVRFKGKKRKWFAFVLEQGKLRKIPLGLLDVPVWKARVKHQKTYFCGDCSIKFRSYEGPECPRCGMPANLVRLDSGPSRDGPAGPIGKVGSVLRLGLKTGAGGACRQAPLV